MDTDIYKSMLTDLIQKQMIMLGPNVALGTARKVPGIKIDDQGQVTEISHDPAASVRGVTDAFMNLSGQIAQMTLKTVLEKYPGIKSGNESRNI
jgi:hypothetical protein